VERNAHLDFLVRYDALEVHVHDDRFGRMALHILEDRCLALFADLDVEDTRVERFVLELLNNSVVVKYQCARRAPAARTFPLVLTDVRNQVEIVTHD
jgi:hypothetical protein